MCKQSHSHDIWSINGKNNYLNKYTVFLQLFSTHRWWYIAQEKPVTLSVIPFMHCLIVELEYRVFPTLHPLWNKTIDSVWKWTDNVKTCMTACRSSLQGKGRHGNAREGDCKSSGEYVDYDGLCGAEEGEELKGDGEQWCEMFMSKKEYWSGQRTKGKPFDNILAKIQTGRKVWQWD